ncbi:MAG: gluconokinase [Acidobacteria bacterium]|nr:gluconokinase [Acidobacteriota bacterium]
MIVIIMGVLGAGKTTIGVLLAEQLGSQFIDADSFHSAGNIEKMRRGVPLTDEDRRPWLEAIQRAIAGWLCARRNVVLACSALKSSYRDKLHIHNNEVKLVYIRATYQLILARLQDRHGHFAGQRLVASQFADLEEPSDAIVVDAACAPQEIVKQIRLSLATIRGRPASP